MLSFRHVNETEIGLMDLSSGLKCVARSFLGHPQTCQLPQFVVHERQQLLRGVRIALLDCGQDECDVVHHNRV